MIYTLFAWGSVAIYCGLSVCAALDNRPRLAVIAVLSAALNAAIYCWKGKGL